MKRFALCLCLLLCTAHAMGEPGVLGIGEIWVSSIPDGARVFVYKQSEFPTASYGFGSSPDLDVNRVLTEVDPVGVTPMKMTLDPGEYLVLFEIKESTERMPDDAARSGWYQIYSEGKQSEPTDWRLYKLTKTPDSPGTLIALFQPREATPEKLDSLFPQGDNFPISESAAMDLITEGGAEESAIPAALSLFRRGGKVAIPGKNKKTTVILEWLYGGGLSVKMYEAD